LDKTNCVLRLNNLCRSQGKRELVGHVYLNIAPGELVGLIGREGSGKTTLFDLIRGKRPPSWGSVKIGGHDLKKDRRHALSRLTSMKKKGRFPGFLSGKTYLALLSRKQGIDPSSRVIKALRLTRLIPHANEKISTYSKEMKLCLRLAAALIRKPAALLLDEPAEGLDSPGAHDFLSLLREICVSEKIGALFSSRLFFTVQEFCHRILVMEQGRIVAAGKPRDIKCPPDKLYRISFLGRVPDQNVLLKEKDIVRVERVTNHSLEMILSTRDARWLREYMERCGFHVAALFPGRKGWGEI